MISGAQRSFFDRLQHAAREEDGPLAIVGIVVAQLVLGHGRTILVVILIINKIDLDARLRYGSHLDDERMIRVVDDQIHTRESDHLMQLATPFVDRAPLRHEGSYLESGFLHFGRHQTSHLCHLRLGDVRGGFLVDKQYFLCHSNLFYRDYFLTKVAINTISQVQSYDFIPEFTAAFQIFCLMASAFYYIFQITFCLFRKNVVTLHPKYFADNESI